jgi:hypothetical protein
MKIVWTEYNKVYAGNEVPMAVVEEFYSIFIFCCAIGDSQLPFRRNMRQACLVHSSILKMKVIFFSEMLVGAESTTRLYVL